MGNSHASTPNVIMLGLDNAGKTTLLYKLLHESSRMNADDHAEEKIISNTNMPQQTIHGSTVGFNLETICGIKVTDVGGSSAMRSLWKNYFHNIRGIIFVFDSSDKKRINLCKNVLHHNILNQKQLKSIPLLIYSNKTDLSKLTNKQEIISMLDLDKIKHREYQIEIISATNNDDNMFNLDAILNGYQWLTDKLLHHHHHKPMLSNTTSNSHDDNHLQIPSNKPTLGRSKSHTLFDSFNLNFSLYSSHKSTRSTTRRHKRSSSLGIFMDRFKNGSFSPTEANGQSTNANSHSLNSEISSIRQLKKGDDHHHHHHNKRKKETTYRGDTNHTESLPGGGPELRKSKSMSAMPGLKAMEQMDDSTLFFFMFGLNGSGKTTIIYHLKYGHFYSTHSQQSYDNVQFLDYYGVNVGIFECDPFRAGKLMKDNLIIKNYHHRINGILFVIDGNDKYKFDEIRTMLRNNHLLQRDNEIPLLIVVNTKEKNHCDKPVMSKNEIIENLDLFTMREIEYQVVDLLCIKTIYDDLEITDKVLKTIIIFLPRTKALQFKDGQDRRRCSIHFVNGFTGKGINFGMNWILANAKTTHSAQKLHIALNVLSKSQNSSPKGINGKQDATFFGDKGHARYVSSTDYLEELMSQGIDDEIPSDEKKNNSLYGDESVMNPNDISSVAGPINKTIW